ncbi:HET-domain-containing protein [Stipitochalara longipes BDJ]|nr:HET-domain-containing protein [Stipitochalara longipes BDJ]
MDNLKDLEAGLPATYTQPIPDVQPYQYHALSSPRSIRVLNVFSCPRILKGEQLQFKLEEVSLDTNPTFEALSYAWGENVFPCVLLCSSHTINITQNLHDALQHFRKPDKELRIWIDAVCINQFDPEEKSHQIPLMEEIYRKASNVLIWLGNESEGSKEVVDYLTHIGNRFLERGGPILEPKVEQHCEEHGAMNKVLWEEVYCDVEMMKKTDVIWKRSWFSRRWVIQEVAFAKKATLFCGMAEIDWDVFAMAAEVLARLEGDGSQYLNRRTGIGRGAPIRGLQNIKNLASIRKEIWTNQVVKTGREMHACLEDARGFECRDDKDRLFALLGIFNYGRKKPFTIDYKKSEAEVFEAFARHCLQENNSVDILSWAGTSNHVLCGESLKMPSWVPDWRLPFRGPTDMLHAFTAGNLFEPMIKFDELTLELGIRGKLIDRVIAVTPCVGEIEEEGLRKGEPKWSIVNPGYIGLWYQFLEMRLFEALEHIGRDRYPYRGGGGSIWDALARTLIMDDKEVPFDYKTQIDNLLAEHNPTNEAQPELPDEFPRFRNWIYVKLGDLTGKNRTIRQQSMVMLDYELMEYFSRAVARSQERRFYVTRKGYIGLGPKELLINDQICVFAGSRVPHALRPQNDDFRAFNEPPRIKYDWCGEVDIGGMRVPYVKRTRKEKFQLIGEFWKENTAVLEDFILL